MTAEHGATWRTSSYSSTQENCVQVAHLPDEVALRDSKDPDGGALGVPPAAFAGLTALFE